MRAGPLALLLLAGCTAVQAADHRMIAVAGGSYRVGDAASDRNPPRDVEVAPFEIAETETTNAQFARFVEATGFVTDAEREGFGMVFEEGMIDWQWRRTPGACWRRPFGDDRFAAATHPEHPVTQISAADAAAYCAWAGGRLPTVVEWEVAARAGAATRYPWGDDFMPGGRAMANIWHGRSHVKDESLDGFLYLSPVKSFPPNRWGLYDVIGNVFEYCGDGVISTIAGAAENLTTARGGSWWCSATTCAAFNLVDIGQMDRRGSLANQGFRMARSR
jgi:sulfatase modifying factor 1